MAAPETVFREFAESDDADEFYVEHNRKRDRVAREELQPLIEEFLNGEVDVKEFRSRIDGLNKRNKLWGFHGFVGQMHFNKLLKASPDPKRFAIRLREAITPPETIDEARETIDDFAEYTQRLKENDIDHDPFPKSTIFFLSYFWHIQRLEEWPIFYPVSEQYLDDEGLLDTGEPYGTRYANFVELMEELREQASEWLEPPVEYRNVANAIYWYEERREEPEPEPGPEPEPTGTFTSADQPFLPSIVADLDAVSEGDDEAIDRYAPYDSDLGTIFERKVGALFQLLGFDTEIMGQGSGRNPDGIAEAVRNNYAVIYDAKKRQDGYRLGRDDRTIRDYIETHSRRLRDQGKQHIYFALVSSSFRDVDESALRDLRTSTDVDNIVLLRADVLQELLELRLREPYLNLDDVEWVFQNRSGEIQSEELENVVPEWRQREGGVLG